jgi:curved DNA-binding protein CbpA
MKSSLRQIYFEAISALQLKEGATPQEIKQSYRNLSKKYHPDLYKRDNGDAFKAINSAYSFLKKHPEPPEEVYQSSTAATTSDPDSDIDRRRSRYWSKKREEAELKEQMYTWIFSKGRAIVFALIFLNTLLAVDYLLPKNQIETEIKTYQYLSQRSSRHSNRNDFIYKLSFEKGYNIHIKQAQGYSFNKGDQYLVFVSPIFNQTTQVQPIKNINITFIQSFSIFKVFGFIIPLALLGSFFYFYGIKNNDYRLTLLLILSMSGLIQLGLLFST